MLIFENVSVFEAIYDVAKRIYPELKDTVIVVGHTSSDSGVLLLEGKDDDAGKFKIVVNTENDNEQTVATYFMGGLAMLIHKLKYNNYATPMEQGVVNKEFEEIMNTLVHAFERVPYGGEYIHE